MKSGLDAYAFLHVAVHFQGEFRIRYDAFESARATKLWLFICRHEIRNVSIRFNLRPLPTRNRIPQENILSFVSFVLF